MIFFLSSGAKLDEKDFDRIYFIELN